MKKIFSLFDPIIISKQWLTVRYYWYVIVAVNPLFAVLGNSDICLWVYIFVVMNVTSVSNYNAWCCNSMQDREFYLFVSVFWICFDASLAIPFSISFCFLWLTEALISLLATVVFFFFFFYVKVSNFMLQCLNFLH